MNHPNFFIVGTPKAGTTSLYHYLEEHPEIFMSPIKETNFFSYDEIKAQGLYYNEEHLSTLTDYLNQFSGVTDQKAVGEASVSYLFYEPVPEKLKAFNPGARIIIVLRNPVDRAFSHYLMDKRLGYTKLSLEAIVNDKDKTPLNKLYYQQYLGLGCYYEQVKRYIDTFDAEQVKIFFYEDVINDIHRVVKEIYEFLGVDATYNADTGQKHNVFLAPKNPLIEKLYASKAFRNIAKRVFGSGLQTKIKNTFFSKGKKPVLDPALKEKVQDIFKEDILKTSSLLNKDLSHWLK